MKKIMITALLALFLSGCDNSPPAPYGFKWGQSVEDIQKLNLGGDGCDFPVCEVTKTPSGVTGSTVLIFNKKLGLVQVLRSEALGETSQQEVMKKFNNAVDEVNVAYGDPTNKIIKIEDESNFIACLNKIGCSKIKAEYDKEGYKVLVSVGIRDKDGKLAILTNYAKPLN
ncbi:TPA: hypothetical protein QH699_000025 [Providencia rettgeri]|nr:hypothetical protein [Providencia rettgeri]